MNKTAVINQLLEQLDQQIDLAAHAADEARDTAVDKENAAENMYDTLGLEAAYLAHGQSERVQALINARAAYRLLRDKPCDSFVDIGSLVSVNNASQTRWFFVGPAAGGMKASIDDVDVLVVTPEAPLGQLLIDQTLGDEISLPGSGAFEIATVE